MSVLIRTIATIYAFLVLIGGLLAADDSAALGYPWLLVVFTSAVHVALALGILSLTYRWYPKWVLQYWKPTFYCCVADLVVGLLMDATIPNDYSFSTHGMVWLTNVVLIVLFLAPAYYLNFKLAFDRYG